LGERKNLKTGGEFEVFLEKNSSLRDFGKGKKKKGQHQKKKERSNTVRKKISQRGRGTGTVGKKKGEAWEGKNQSTFENSGSHQDKEGKGLLESKKN